MRPQVIILNGISSVGKSATAKALQAITSEPFLHIAMDTFLEMLPDKMFDHPDGLSFEPGQEDGKPIIAIRTGPTLERTMRGMRHAVAAMAMQGNNLIIDEVMLEASVIQEYHALLRSFGVQLISLFAPLDVLEERELARGNREVGLARWQYGRVHHGISYDLEVDTAVLAPAEAARLIQRTFRL